MTELTSVGKISIVTELAKPRRNYVAIETIYVATELAGRENSIAHDRIGVRGLGAQRHALGMHYIEARATENSLS